MSVKYYEPEQQLVLDFEHDSAEMAGLSIRSAVDSLHKKINLYHYDLVVIPESRNRVNQYMMRYIYRFNQPKLCNVEDILSKTMVEELCAMIRQHNILIVVDEPNNEKRVKEVVDKLRFLIRIIR